ncbi:MAG: hypothetical protein R3E79_54620 [Caldilineaceae bacterium]
MPPVPLAIHSVGNTSQAEAAVPLSAPFDWLVYADATLAGLSVLIPIPLVDMAFEAYFRRRMIQTIAKRSGQPLAPAVRRLLQQEADGNVWRGCLLWPMRLLGEFLVRLSRKILYFLTVKKAIDSLNYYWQRAFLINYMAQQGYLTQENAAIAVAALEMTLATTGRSPLQSLAREIVYSPFRLWRTLWRARAERADPLLTQISARLSHRWGNFDSFFANLAQHYKQVYRQQQTQE